MVYCRRRGELHALCVEGLCRPPPGTAPGAAALCVFDPWDGLSRRLDTEEEESLLFLASWDASQVRTVRFPAKGLKLCAASIEASF